MRLQGLDAVEGRRVEARRAEGPDRLECRVPGARIRRDDVIIKMTILLDRSYFKWEKQQS